MATIKRKQGTENWIACYTDAGGKRVQRSTGLPGKREAQKKADEMEREALKPKPVEAMSLNRWAAGWLAANKGAVSNSTYLAYEHRSGHFVDYLGERAGLPLDAITKADVVAYRTALGQKLRPVTVNLAVKTIRMMFEAARREELIARNPAEGLKALKDEDRVERRPFTEAELGQLLRAAEGEWLTMILFGIYTGQRLNDMALFRWKDIDGKAGEIRFRDRKTGKQMVIPVAPPLARHLGQVKRDGEYVMPDCARAVLAGKERAGTTLSGQFRALMAAAGLGKVQPHRALKNGRNASREMRELVFHSLRHTATSLMKNAGVSGAVVMDIIGHASPAVSAHYTKIDAATKRKALDSLPDLVGGKE